MPSHSLPAPVLKGCWACTQARSTQVGLWFLPVVLGVLRKEAVIQDVGGLPVGGGMAPEGLDRPRWQGQGQWAFLRVRTLAARVAGAESGGNRAGAAWSYPHVVSTVQVGRKGKSGV